LFTHFSLLLHFGLPEPKPGLKLIPLRSGDPHYPREAHRINSGSHRSHQFLTMRITMHFKS
jgi:hypothetical protein